MLLAQANIPQYPSGFKFPWNPATKDMPIVANVISNVLKYVYVFAGLMLLIWLVWGGIILMTSAGDQNKMAQGYGKISGALIGFLIIFVSYFVVQIVEIVLGVKIF